MAQQGKAGSAKKARRKATKGKDAELVPHYDVLSCEYHVSIVAGLSLIGQSLLPTTSQNLYWSNVRDSAAWHCNRGRILIFDGTLRADVGQCSNLSRALTNLSLRA